MTITKKKIILIIIILFFIFILIPYWFYLYLLYFWDYPKASRNATRTAEASMIYRKIMIQNVMGYNKTFIIWKDDIENWEEIPGIENSKYLKWKIDFEGLNEEKENFLISEDAEIFAIKYEENQIHYHCHHIRVKWEMEELIEKWNCPDFLNINEL